MTAFNFASNLSMLTGLLPLLAAGFNYKHLDKVLKLSAAFFLLSFLSDAISWLLIFVFRIPNTMYVSHLYVDANILFFGVIYYFVYFDPIFKKIAIFLATIAFLIAVSSIFFAQSLREYPSIANTALSIMAVLLSLLYFYQLFTRQEFIHIQKEGFFWINSGVIFYYSITIFMFMMYKQILLAHQQDYYMINYITNIIANLIFSAGLLCKPQKTT